MKDLFYYLKDSLAVPTVSDVLQALRLCQDQTILLHSDQFSVEMRRAALEVLHVNAEH